MKKILFFLVLISAVIGCQMKSYHPAEFFIINKTDEPIIILSSALVRQTDVHTNEGYIEKSIKDVLEPQKSLSLRRISVSDSVQISDVFTNLEVYKNKVKATIDLMNTDLWEKSIDTDGKINYTISIEPTAF